MQTNYPTKRHERLDKALTDFFQRVWKTHEYEGEYRDFTRIAFPKDPRFYLYYELWKDGYVASISFFGNGEIQLYNNLEFVPKFNCNPGFVKEIKPRYTDGNVVDLVSKFLDRVSENLFSAETNFKEFYKNNNY